jgi:hypothetical protein
MNWTLFVFLSACSTTSVEGVVMDASGSPIPGAKVSRQASDCSTLTREDGRFELRCDAGTWKISIRHPSFFSKTETVDVPDGHQVILERSTLIQVPESDGLHLLRDASFVPLVPTTLERASNSNGEAKRRDFCVDRDRSAPNKVSSGTLRLLERSPTTPWRMFRMDPAGCAYRDSRNQEGRWVVEHRDRAKVSLEPEIDGTRIHQVKVEAGGYFIAEWSGFFVPTGPKANTYKGYWVQVQD